MDDSFEYLMLKETQLRSFLVWLEDERKVTLHYRAQDMAGYGFRRKVNAMEREQLCAAYCGLLPGSPEKLVLKGQCLHCEGFFPYDASEEVCYDRTVDAQDYIGDFLAWLDSNESYKLMIYKEGQHKNIIEGYLKERGVD